MGQKNGALILLPSRPNRITKHGEAKDRSGSLRMVAIYHDARRTSTQVLRTVRPLAEMPQGQRRDQEPRRRL